MTRCTLSWVLADQRGSHLSAFAGVPDELGSSAGSAGRTLSRSGSERPSRPLEDRSDQARVTLPGLEEEQGEAADHSQGGDGHENADDVGESGQRPHLRRVGHFSHLLRHGPRMAVTLLRSGQRSRPSRISASVPTRSAEGTGPAHSVNFSLSVSGGSGLLGWPGTSRGPIESVRPSRRRTVTRVHMCRSSSLGISGSTVIVTRLMRDRTAGSRTFSSLNVAMPTRPSARAAAAENSPENLASRPLFGFEWIRMRGTVLFTPIATEAICSGWSA